MRKKGYGTGLSLVKTIISEMDAEMKIEDNHPSGIYFVITFIVLHME